MARPDPWDQFEDARGGFVEGDPSYRRATASPVAAAAPGRSGGSAADAFEQFQDAPAGGGRSSALSSEAHSDLIPDYEAPPQAASHMTPEQEAQYNTLIRTGSADNVRAFLHSVGASSAGDLDAFVAARDRAKAAGQPVNYDVAYALPQNVSTTTGGAAGRGALQGLSFGLGPQIGGVRDGIIDAVHGGSYSQGYDRSIDQSRAELGADARDHWWPSTLGNLAGSLAVPVGLGRAGVTASLRVVGAEARDAAIAAGMAPGAADQVAAKAIAHRLAKEGAAYGGLQGAGEADGGAGERFAGGVQGAAIGSVLGRYGIPLAERALGGVGRGVRGAWNAATGSFTRSGAERAAGDVLRDNTLRPIEDVVNDIATRAEPVAGSRPTLGEVANDAGLAGFQRGVTNSSGEAGAIIGERHAQNAIARTGYADEALGAGNPQAIQDVAVSRVGTAEAATRGQQAERAAAAEQRLADLRAGAAADRTAAGGAVADARAAIGPAVDRTATGQAARSSFERAHDAAKARTSTAYNAPALLDNEPVVLRPSDLADHVLPTYGRETDLGAFKSQVVQGVKGALPDRPQSLLQFVRARGGVNAEGMGAADLRHVGMGSRDLPTFLNRTGPGVDSHLEAAIESGFVHPDTSMSEFLDHLDNEHRGLSRNIRPEDVGSELDYQHALTNRQTWDRELGDRGLDPLKMNDAEWRGLHEETTGRTGASRTLADIEHERPPGAAMGPFQKSIASLRQQYFGDGATSVPADAGAFFNDVMNADTVGIRTLEGWERRANDMAARAPDRTTAAFLKGIGRVVAAKADDAGGPGRRAALIAARAARREQGRIFEAGDASKVFGADRYGNPIVGDTSVPSRLVRPGPPGGDTVDGLIAAIGPDAAEQTMRQELRRVVDEKGVTTEAQARSLAVTYGEAAKRFLGLRSDLQALVGHAGRLDAAAAAERNAERATTTAAEKAHINELSAAEAAIKASPLYSLRDADKDAASYVGELLNRNDAGRRLKRLASDVAGNSDAVAGLRRSFGQYLVKAGEGVRNTAAGDDIPSLAKTRKAVSTIITRAGDLLTPQQKIALQRVSRELKATNFAMNAGRPGGSDTVQNAGYRAALHFFPLAVPHAGGAKAVLSVLASVMTNKAQVQHLITQAILDPEFAATLLKRPTAAHLEAARAQLLGRKALVASTLVAQPMEQAAERRAVGR